MSDIQRVIEKEIPIVKEMGVQFEKFADDHCVITVPLEPNHNHKGTAFGGSLYSVSAAACYGLLYSLQRQFDLNNSDLLIMNGSMKYVKPVTGNFKVKSSIKKEDWKILVEDLPRKGFGKIDISAIVFIDSEETPLCHFTGVFVFKSV